MKSELQENVSCEIRQCSREDLPEQSRRLPGVLIVWIAGAAPAFDPLVPKGIPCYSITICDPTEHMERIRQLRQPSVIAVVSVSKLFVERATGVISPLLGALHSLSEYLLPVDGRLTLNGADLVFSDSVSLPRIQARNIRRYRVISRESLEQIGCMIRPNHKLPG